MKCTNCRHNNPINSLFCEKCGNQLAVPAVPTVADPPLIHENVVDPSLIPADPLSPQTTSPSSLAHRPAQVTTTERPMGTGGVSIAYPWGPFAGRGTRGRHVSWLLDNLGNRTEELDKAISDRFQQRQIPRAYTRKLSLTARGLVVEKRPYYVIQRGITTVALYVARFGQDLFISQVTYAKGPINHIRVAILVLMLLFQVYYMVGYTTSLEGAIGAFNPLLGSGSGDFGSIIFLTCVVGPMGLLNTFLLGLGFLFSVYKWLKERDFLAILRTPPNEFQLDDIIALEKAVEETVRQSLDSLAIQKELMTPTTEQSFVSQRVRLI